MAYSDKRLYGPAKPIKTKLELENVKGKIKT